MKLANIIRKTGPDQMTGLFGIKLTGMRVLPYEEQRQYDNFIQAMMHRQMDFIYALNDLPRQIALDLRYLFDPQHPYRIRIFYLVQIKASNEESISRQIDSFSSSLLHLLMVNNSLHEFEFISDQNELSYLVQPFDFTHVAELVRREGRIRLDCVDRNLKKILGFSTNSPSCRPKESLARPGEEIYCVFPYAPGLENMERLCHLLYSRLYPCMISVCLSPYQLTEQDHAVMAERIKLCEKYSQLPLDGSGEVEKLEPFLVNQAKTLYDLCSKEYLQLQDAAFLLKVQIASPQEIPSDLSDILGITVTRHAGHPVGDSSEALEKLFSGGYLCFQSNNELEFGVALNNLQYREFNPWIPSTAPSDLRHWRYFFDVSEASAAFRLPVPNVAEFPGIDTILFHFKPAPSDLPASGILLGEHIHLNRSRPVYIKPLDRMRHMYVVGKTGTGKSTFFLQMILQDLEAGNGLGLIDPHGELVDQVLQIIPKKREKDVVYLNPQDYERPFGINLLESSNFFEKDFNVNYIIEVFDMLYDLKQTGGPIFEMYMRNALQLLLDQPEGYRPTILDVPRLFQDWNFRNSLLRNCTNIYVYNFWEKEANAAERDMSLANVAPYITSKLCRFVYNDLIRTIIGQRTSTVNFREIMDSGKILLADLRKGILGDTNSHFLGMILVGKIFTAAMSRTESRGKGSLRNFYLYVDEFHNLATPTFISILSEARKYRLSLILTNQYIAQLKDYIIQGIFGNIGSLVSFRVGSGDAELLSKEFSRIVSENDLMGLSNFQTYLKLLIDGKVSAPFNMRTLLPQKSLRPKAIHRIGQESRQLYGRSREDVEAEIKKCWIRDEAHNEDEVPDEMIEKALAEMDDS